MAKYYIDFEFIEGFHKPLFGKRRHFIDMISVGIVCDDGREYYAISNEWRYKDADKWVKENIIHKLPLQLGKETIGEFYKRCKLGEDYKGEWYKGKSNKQIAKEIHQFVNPHINDERGDYFYDLIEDKKYCELHNIKTYPPDTNCPYTIWRSHPEFYGYYADYDWVLLCSLFGRMIDLPKGFPMYCIDLKQILDEVANNMDQLQFSKFVVSSNTGKWTTGEIPKSIIDINSWDKQLKLELLKSQEGYPKQQNEHNALEDAKWNMQLHNFINTLTNT